MSQNKAFLVVNTQFDNAGDALILRELIRLTLSRAETHVYLGRTPPYFVDMLKLDNTRVCVHRRQGYVAACLNMLWLRLRGATCFYFLTPGGLNGEKTKKQFASEGVRMVMMWMLAFLGIRICQLAFSLERIGRRHAMLLRWRSRFLYRCAPRDKISAEYGKRLGIRITDVIPDLAFAVSEVEPGTRLQERKKVGVSFRVDKDSTLGEQFERVVLSVAEALDGGEELICIAQVGRDAGFMKKICETASSVRPGQVSFERCDKSIDRALEIYGECRAVLSNRLHVLLLALKAGSTPVAVIDRELDTKVTSIFEGVGLGDHLVDARATPMNFDPELLGPTSINSRQYRRKLVSYFDQLFNEAEGVPIPWT